jgi:hypothetical protein
MKYKISRDIDRDPLARYSNDILTDAEIIDKEAENEYLVLKLF